MTTIPETQQATSALSMQQQFLCMFAQGFEAGPFGPHYVEVFGWRLRGRVDVGTLRLALADVVERHEALRTVVHLDSGTQSVLPAGEPELQVVDLDETAGADRDRRAEQLMIEAETRPFPIHEIPLLRAVLGRFDEQDSVLVLSAHHSAADVWSIQVILQDLAECYAARVAGDEPRLPDATQYRDYVAAQQEDAAGPTVAAARAYWRETLRGARILVAPVRRNEQVTPATSYHRFVTDAQLSTEVSRLAKATRSSPFMVLLAAFTVFVNRRTQATDIVVPTFAPGRRHGFQATVGSFFNFVPLRVDLSECRTFRDVVARTRTACVGAFKHELPLLHVLAEAPELMASVGPDAVPTLFQAVQPPYLAQGKRIGDIEYTAIWRRVIPQPMGSETPDGMIWSMHLSNTEVVGGLSFSRHLFDQAEVHEQVAGYLRVIGEMVADPDSAI
jgi:hypothetical protein